MDCRFLSEVCFSSIERGENKSLIGTTKSKAYDIYSQTLDVVLRNSLLIRALNYFFAGAAGTAFVSAAGAAFASVAGAALASAGAALASVAGAVCCCPAPNP